MYLPPEDRSLGPRPEEPFPPAGMWSPGKRCPKKDQNCQGTAIGNGEPCNWCGLKEDGTYD